MKNDKTTTNKFYAGFKELEFGIDTEKRIVYLTSDIDSDLLYATITRLDFLYKKNKTKPITMLISSYGGDVYSMLGIHDYMRNFPTKINTLCVGFAMSAGAFLLTSGTGKRIMTANSTVMFHEFSSMVEGKTKAVVNNVYHIKILQKKINKLLGTYTKKPSNFWDKSVSEDLYIPAEQCLDFGIVDEIVNDSNFGKMYD